MAAGLGAILAITALVWSRVTPDTSFFSRFFPTTAPSAEQPVTAVESPGSAGATEQSTPEQSDTAHAADGIQPAKVEPAPAVVPRDDSASAARRAANQLEEKKERVVRTRHNVAITMYSTAWCHVCVDARRYLAEAGVTYDEYDVDKDRDADRRLRAINPRHTVPTFDIDGLVLTGFSPGAFESMLTSAAAKRAERE